MTSLKRRKLERAVREQRAALDRDPHDFAALLVLGEALLELGHVEEAVATLEHAQSIDGERTSRTLARAYATRARDRADAEDEQAAVVDAERALNLVPDQPEVAALLRKLLAQRPSPALAPEDEDRELLEAALGAAGQAEALETAVSLFDHLHGRETAAGSSDRPADPSPSLVRGLLRENARLRESAARLDSLRPDLETARQDRATLRGRIRELEDGVLHKDAELSVLGSTVDELREQLSASEGVQRDFLAEVERLQTEYVEAQGALAELRDNRERLRASGDSQRLQQERLTTERDALSGRLAEAATDLDEARAELERVAAESRGRQAELERVAADQEKQRAEFVELRDRTESTAAERDRLAQAEASARAALESARAALERAAADQEKQRGDFAELHDRTESTAAERDRLAQAEAFARAELESARAALERAAIEQERQRAELAELRQAIDTLTTERDQAVQDAETARVELSRAKGESQEGQRQLNELAAELESLRRKERALHSELATEHSEHSGAKTALANAISIRAELEERLAQSDAKRDRLERDLERSTIAYDQRKAALEALEDQHKTLNVAYDAIRERRDALERDRDNLRHDADRLRHEVERLSGCQRDLEAELAALSDANTKLEGRAGALEGQLKEAAQQRDDATREVSQLRAQSDEKDALMRGLERTESFPPGSVEATKAKLIRTIAELDEASDEQEAELISLTVNLETLLAERRRGVNAEPPAPGPGDRSVGDEPATRRPLWRDGLAAAAIITLALIALVVGTRSSTAPESQLAKRSTSSQPAADSRPVAPLVEADTAEPIEVAGNTGDDPNAVAGRDTRAVEVIRPSDTNPTSVAPAAAPPSPAARVNEATTPPPVVDAQPAGRTDPRARSQDDVRSPPPPAPVATLPGAGSDRSTDRSQPQPRPTRVAVVPKIAPEPPTLRATPTPAPAPASVVADAEPPGDRIERLLLAAIALEGRGEDGLPAATSLYREVLGLQPGQPEALARLENIAESYVELGDSWLVQGAYDRAIEQYNAAIELTPDLAVAYFQRGRARFGALGGAAPEAQAGGYDQALADFDRAIELAPGEAGFRSGRALSLLSAALDGHPRGDLARALNDLDRAIELDPAQGFYYYARANARYQAGLGDADTGADLDRIIADVSRAIDLEPGNPEYYFRRAQTRYELAAGTAGGADILRAAMQDLTRAIEIDDQNPEYFTWRARTRADLGDVVGREQDLRRAIALERASRPRGGGGPRGARP